MIGPAVEEKRHEAFNSDSTSGVRSLFGRLWKQCERLQHIPYRWKYRDKSDGRNDIFKCRRDHGERRKNRFRRLK